MSVTDLKTLLTRDEGQRLKPYVDTVGKVTIGVGRNLTDVGISQDECDLLLEHDIAYAEADVLRNMPWATEMDEVRYAVLVSMVFNMGIESVLAFRNTLEKIRTKDYVGASAEMLQSKWATQVGARAHRLSQQLSTGAWV